MEHLRSFENVLLRGYVELSGNRVPIVFKGIPKRNAVETH